jgi:hypothetical protein
VFTVKEFVKLCKESLPLYDMYIEDNGISGDIEVAEQLEVEKHKLEEILSNMLNTLETNKLISVTGYIVWLQQQDKEVANILFSCLEMIKQDRLYKIKGFQKEVGICEQFLKSQVLFTANNGSK